VLYAAGAWAVQDSVLGQRVLGNVVYLGPVIAALVLSVAVVRSGRGRRPVWSALVISNLLWLGGELVWAWYDFARDGDVPFPGLHDPLYLSSYAVSAVAVLMAFGTATALRQWRGLVDAAVVSVSVVYLGWEIAVAPVLGDAVTTETLLGAAYPLSGLMSLVLLLTLGLAGHVQVPVSTTLFIAAIGAGAFTNLLWTYLTVVHSYSAGGYLDLGWQLQGVLLVLAAVQVLRHGEAAPQVRQSLRDLGLLPSLVGTASCLALVVHDLRYGHLRTSGAVVVLLVAVGLMVRLWLTLRDREIVATALDRALRTQQQLAVTDPLTGLYNRRFLEETLRLQAQGRPAQFAVLLVDLDHFKVVNDTYGHTAGDRVLVEAAHRLQQALRPRDALARYGGEEFAAVLPDLGGEALLEVAERVRRVLADRPFVLEDGSVLELTGSIGASLYPEDAADTDGLLKAADRALYAAKGAGRDRVVLASAGPVEALPVALPAMQLLADVVDGRLSGQEHSTAVSRWVGLVAEAQGLPVRTRGRAVLAARLHDVGKIALPEALLRKPARLDEREWLHMQEHPALGAELLEGTPGGGQLAPFVRAHHERWDGTGYPDRLQGDAIPLESRVIAVCDAYAAMVTDRHYARALTPEQALQQLVEGTGTQFDPQQVRVFLALHATGAIDAPLVLAPTRPGLEPQPAP